MTAEQAQPGRGTILAGPSIGERAGGRDNNFNLIRMCAAFGVLVSHAWPIALGPATVQPLERWLDGITLGTLCVYIFFAVSGFFITRSFDTRRDPGAFLRARGLRLFPALAVVLVLTVLAAAAFTSAPQAIFWRAVPEYVMRNLTLFFLRYDLPGIFGDTPYGPPINGSLWTLNYEVLCYLGVFLAGMAGWLTRRGGLAILGLVIALHGLAATGALPYRAEKLIELALPFAFGAAFWIWRDRIRLSPVLALVLAALAVLAHGTPVFDLVFVLAVSYAVFVLGYWPSRALQRYNALGDYSYGVYIYAFPLQQLGASLGMVTPWANIAFATPPVLLLAVASWHLVEHPALRFKPAPRRTPARKDPAGGGAG